MAHKYEIVTTGNGISVKNGSTTTQVITQAGALVPSVAIGAGSIAATNLASNAVETAKIKDANVTLAKLASGIAPAYIVKYAGTATMTDSSATKAVTVSGVLATDLVVATILVNGGATPRYIASAVPTTDTVTITWNDTATTGDKTSYLVLRVAA